MKELIEALQIFLKYGDVHYPFVCEHDKLHVVGYDHSTFSKEDKNKLEELGFSCTTEGEPYDNDTDEIADETEIYSYKYGSA